MKSTEEMLQAAVQQLQTAEQARLTSETDPARRQLLHLLYAREAAALQSITLVRAEIPATQKRDWKPLIFPLAVAVLNLGALALWLTLPNCVTPENSGWMGRFALCIVAQSVSLCAAIGSIVSAMRRKPPKPVVVADETEFRRRLVEAEGRIALDAQTIEALFAQESVTIISTGAETAAELYASLYEMAQDARLDGNASQEKALSWPLSNAKRLLNAVGCEAVDYTPETAMFYDVMDADITQQRRPAIVQKADGIVQQRGTVFKEGVTPSLPPCRAHRRESPCNNQNQETWVCIAKGSRGRPQSPLVASAEAKSSACRKDMPCLQDQQRGRANGQVVSRAAWGALLRKRKVTGRDASLPAPLLAFPFELVARGTVGALPQTPQGALPLDPARGIPP